MEINKEIFNALNKAVISHESTIGYVEQVRQLLGVLFTEFDIKKKEGAPVEELGAPDNIAAGI